MKKPVQPPAFLAPTAVLASADGKTAYVAEEEAQRIDILDIAAGKITASLPVIDKPTGMVLSADGKTLYVTAGCPAGVVVVQPLEGRSAPKMFEAGHSPTAPVLSADGKTLFVCDRFRNQVLKIDLATGASVAIPVDREPVAAALTPDGSRLVVTNLLPAGPANGETTAATVSLIDPAAGKVAKTIHLVNGSISLRGVAVSADGRFAFVTEVLARYQVPTTQIERGWICTNALAIIDLKAETLYATVLLDDPELGAANPWPVAITADGKTLCVGHAGCHELSLVNLEKLLAKLERRLKELQAPGPGASRPASPETDLAFIQEVRTRIPVPVNGIRSLALAGRQAVVPGYYSDSIAMLDLNQPANARQLALGQPWEKLPVARRGDAYYNDANYCFQKWLSCASCHPDGRVDALNWDLLNDGMGNPKNTRTMLYSIYTPPAMSLGIRESAQVAIRSGMNKIQFHRLDEKDAGEVFPAIEAYVSDMKPVPSPWRTRDGQLTAKAKEGEAIFQRAGCVACHNGPYLTCMQQVDIGTATGIDQGKPIDVPTLYEVWRTGPYFHDGRAATLHEAIVLRNKAGDRNHQSFNLTDPEIDALVEYIRSL